MNFEIRFNWMQQGQAAIQSTVDKLNRSVNGMRTPLEGASKGLKAFAGSAQLLSEKLAGTFAGPAMDVARTLGDIREAAQAAGVGLGPVAVGVASVTAVVAAGVTAFQAYKAKLEEIRVAAALAFNQSANRLRLFDLLESNANRLNPGEAAKLRQQLAQGIADGNPAEAELRIRSRLREVILSEEQKKQLDEIGEIGRRNLLDQLTGFDQLKAQADEAYRKDKADLALREQAAKTVADQQQVQLAYMAIEQAHALKIEQIEKDRAEAHRQEQRQMADDIARREKAADDFYAREAAAQQEITREITERERRAEEFYRNEDRRRVSQSPFIPDATKYTQLQGLGVDKTELGADPNSFLESFTARFTALQNAVGTFSQNAADLIAGGLGSAIQGVSDGISGAILKTQTWGQIFVNICQSMIRSVVDLAVKGLMSFVLAKAKELVITEAVETSKTAITQANTKKRGLSERKEGLSAGFALASKAAGSVADIPYVGWALAIAAFASVMAMVLAASAIGFQQGGYTGRGPANEPAGIVHRGEYVVPAWQVGRIGLDNLSETLNGMAGLSGRLIAPTPITSDNSESGAAVRRGMAGGAGAGNVSVSPTPVTVLVVNDQSQYKRFLESRAGERIIVQHVDGNRRELGMQT